MRDAIRLVSGFGFCICVSVLIGFWAEDHGYIVKNEFGREFWFQPGVRQWVNDHVCFWRW